MAPTNDPDDLTPDELRIVANIYAEATVAVIIKRLDRARATIPVNVELVAMLERMLGDHSARLAAVLAHARAMERSTRRPVAAWNIGRAQRA